MTLWSIFVTIFFAELGDKTQLATLLFAADRSTPKLGVFAASAGALVLSSLIAVLVGWFTAFSLYTAAHPQAGGRHRISCHWSMGAGG